MRKFVLNRCLFSMILILIVKGINAQQLETIHGYVKDSLDGKSLPGVVIKLKGTSTNAISDDSGYFSIKAPIGASLDISYVGYGSKTLTINNNNIIISLAGKSSVQSEVVVVAMDMKRKSRELGYSVQTVSGAEIKNTQRENFITALQGRVAGLTINTTGGMAGASSQIILRGFNSASLSNQPLFVIDGVIMDNSSFSESNLADDRSSRTNDYINRGADINPSDIESITILKGPEATALYGSQASSGAIVITTKKASGQGVQVFYDNSFRWDKITRFPKTIDNFSSGTSGVYDQYSFTYFGPAYPDDVKKYDNIGNFYQSGFANTQNIAANFGSKVSAFRLSGSFFKNSGFVPNNTYRRYTIKLSNTTHIGKKLDITPAITFADANTRRPMKGGGSSMLTLFVWPTTDDASNYEDEMHNKRTLYTDAPNSESYDNPFFAAYRNYSGDKNRRIIANMGIDYRPTSWLSFAGRFGYDTYKDDIFIITDPQSSNTTLTQKGYLSNAFQTVKNYNHTITGSANKKFGKFSTRLMLGTMWLNNEQDVWAKSGSNLLDAANNLSQSHSTDTSNIGTTQYTNDRYSRGLPDLTLSRLIAYFGEASIGYDDKVFLSYTHRFESSSIFPKNNRSYNYPGISLSLIMTDIFPSLKSSTLSYWKLRGSRAQTARLSTPYANQSTFVKNYASSDAQAYSYGYYNNNTNLKPERQRTFEIGTEVKMFHNIVSLEAAYYNTHNMDQISVGYRASYGTGFILNTQNATESRNQGIELTLNVHPIHTTDFDWNITFNFNHMWSNVISIPESIGQNNDYYMSETWSAYNVRGGFVRNHPTTLLTGYSYSRNNKGQVLINPSTGLPVINTSFSPIGDRNPKFRLGTINSFHYKNFDLSFLWDLRVGGDVFNATNMFLTYIGKSAKTADRMSPRVIKGVLNDGLQNTDNPTQNTIMVTPYYMSNYYYSETNGLTDEEFIEKHVNWLRLKDITLSYNVAEKTLHRYKVLKSVKALSVFATANELFLFTNYTGADPDVNSNNASLSGVGGFGIDYGNTASPISVNAGLRVSF